MAINKGYSIKNLVYFSKELNLFTFSLNVCVICVVKLGRMLKMN